ncbi:MAG: zinc ribbon domain-containing protein [Clostridiales bacterium]|nr:zinc ribbon domain-containing protein [Clostridiales bacterium]
MTKCLKCGSMMESDDKYCFNCGMLNSNVVLESENNDNTYEKRDVVYDGIVHKCPNCGGVLDGLGIKCELCGYEIRGEESGQSVKDLLEKLDSIEQNREKPTRRESMAASWGLPTSIDNYHKAKANVIMNYAIPNTKEDILDFMVLATSNIMPDIIVGSLGRDPFESNRLRIEQDAWISKMDQAYKKAKVLYGDDVFFQEIERLYEGKKREVKLEEKKLQAEKRKIDRSSNIGIVTCLLVLGLLIVFGTIWVKYENGKQQQEVRRLEAIVEEIENDIEDGNYDSAMRNTRKLRYQGPENDSLEEEWEDIRKEYMDLIESADNNA